MYKILLADDVKLTLASEKAYLEGRNLKVFATTSPSEARELAGVVQPDLDITKGIINKARRGPPLNGGTARHDPDMT